MTCYTPVVAYRSKDINSSGKRSLVFSKDMAVDDREVRIPCRSCEGCIIERSKQWATRCLHESSMHKVNSYITLTYDDDNLPANCSLNLKDFQKFLKRLRVAVERKGEYFDCSPDNVIRYFHCGEYGDLDKRPHYHAILFGVNWPDRRFLKVTPAGSNLYTSELLQRLWPFGFSSVGDVTFRSCAYVARYINKKIVNRNVDMFYTHVDDNGVVHQIQPEYITMSRCPGIGSSWYERYKSDCFPSDFITVEGHKQRIPSYYDGKFAKEDGICGYTVDDVKAKRQEYAVKHAENSTDDRLAVRREIQRLRLIRLKRTL